MMGQDVLAVDKDGELVNRWSSQIPTVQADMTDVMALEQINASDFDTAVVAIGDSVEASVITAGNLLDAGISDIWAKSVSKEHARILQRIGARHIINAETDAGKRVGHLVSGNYLDYIELEGAYNVVKIHTPAHVVGYTIEDARVHERFGITVVASNRRARNRIRFERAHHAPQRRTHHHGQAESNRPVPTQLTRSFHMENPEFHNHDFRFFFYLSYLP